MWHFRMGEPFFMILCSIQMGSGSFNASAWKVCFREASAKLPQRTWTLLPKTYQDHGHLVFTHSSCKTYCKYITSYNAQYVLYVYRRYLCMMRIWNVKKQNHKSCKTHFRETSTLKNLKIASASFRDCSPVQVFDSYVQILHSEYDNIKTETQMTNFFA